MPFSFYVSLGNNITHLHGKLEAINIGTQPLLIKEKYFLKAAIISYAICVIQAVVVFEFQITISII